MSIAVRSLQDAQAVVMEGVTGLVSLDPEAASQGALMANRAFASGTVEQVLKSHGVWRTVVSARGERIEISIARRSWWRRAVRASG
ncbi:hypothetical protein AB0G74_12845 [Streptomyces sp. NPDC020875]|uniref:hypothetical protein n=1 Tax=Streptomyces sp. NPDC020875 TaxID=3154898 RepID=UPI0033D02282